MPTRSMNPVGDTVVGTVFLCRGDGLLGRREGLSCDIIMMVGACQCVWELNEHASVERASVGLMLAPLVVLSVV